MDIRAIVKEEFIVLNDDATLSELIGKLRQYEKKSCLVFHNKKYLGLIQKRHLLHTRLDSSTTKVRPYVQKTPILTEDAEAVETAAVLYGSNLDFLPVQREKEIIGVVRGLDVILLCSTLPELLKIRVNDVKLLRDCTVEKDDPIAKAIDLMHEERVDHIPVLTAGNIYGILSYKDILRKYLNWSPKRDISVKFNKMAGSRGAEVDMPHLASLPVHNFSSNDNLHTVPPGELLTRAIELMVSKNVSAILVQENEHFLGILTLKNILGTISLLQARPGRRGDQVQYIGLRDLKLTENQGQLLQKIVELESGKLQRQVRNELMLVLHFKTHDRDAKKQKYSVHLKVEYPGRILTVSQDDWDFETALHKTFDNARNALKNRFKGEGKKEKGITKRVHER